MQPISACCVYGMEGPGAQELATLRSEVASGQRDLITYPATFSLAELHELSHTHAEEIAVFTQRRKAGFCAERERWAR